MGKIWPLQDAKARLSELVRASEKEAQTITLRGEEKAVVISPGEYRRLKGAKGKARPKSLYEALRACPAEFPAIPRSRDRGRDIDL